MARYNPDDPYTVDYEDDCAYCGHEWPRGELAWSPENELECPTCEHKRVQRAAAQSMADQGYTVECQGEGGSTGRSHDRLRPMGLPRT